MKQIVRELLADLKSKFLVLDWRKKQQARAQVQLAITSHLDKLPNTVYTQELYDQKCLEVYEHIRDAYYGEQRSLYA